MNINDFRRYFNGEKPLGSIALLILGMLSILLGCAIDGLYIIAFLGIAMSALGLCMAFKFNSAVSDGKVDSFCRAQADSYRNEKRADVVSKGTEIIDEICTDDYSFENYFSARLAVRGKDKLWRSSIYKSTCLFFSESTVYYFCNRISLITCESVEKKTEFRFKDIQMVSIEEFRPSIIVVITIPGNEKIHISCKSREYAEELCSKIKQKMYLQSRTD